MIAQSLLFVSIALFSNFPAPSTASTASKAQPEASLSPLEIFTNRNALRDAPVSHFNYASNQHLQLAVSPFGFIDVMGWYTKQMTHLQKTCSENTPNSFASLNKHPTIHSTKISIQIQLIKPPSTPSSDPMKVCIHSSKGLKEIVCTSVLAAECDQPFTVNLGPEAGGGYLLSVDSPYAHSSNTAIEFEIHGSQPVKNKCSGTDFDIISAGHTVGDHPRVEVPKELCSAYTLDDQIPVSHWYFDDKSDKPSSYQPRSLSEIQNFMSLARSRKQYYYKMTDTWLYEALDQFPIRGKKVLIMGSNVPWYESICMVFGAAECVTVEYNELQYDHPNITTHTVEHFRNMWDSGSLQPGYDFVWSISSFEHDGLGRYGDPLNPNGDLEAMESCAKYLKDNTGVMMLAVPVGRDEVRWNEGRVYGRQRLNLLLKGFDVVGTFGFAETDLDKRGETESVHQPVFVVTKR